MESLNLGEKPMGANRLYKADASASVDIFFLCIRLGFLDENDNGNSFRFRCYSQLGQELHAV